METTRAKVTAEERIAKFKQGYDAFNKRDFARAAETYHDSIVWHFVAGDVRGKDAVVAYAQDQATRLNATLVPHDILTSDEHVVALLTYTVNGKPFKLIHIAHTDDEGKTTEGWSFGEPELAKIVLSR